MHAPRQILVQWRCSSLLIVAPMIPSACIKSKMPIFGKARKSHELWFGVPGRCATFVFFFLWHKKKELWPS
jgi:hypothetical protein